MAITPRVGQQEEEKKVEQPPPQQNTNQGQNDLALVGSLRQGLSKGGKQYITFNLNFARSKDPKLRDKVQDIADAIFSGEKGANFVAFQNKKKVTGDNMPDFWVFMDLAKVNS